MKFKIIISVFVITFFFGCSTEDSQLLNSESLVSDTTVKGPEKPFKITGYGTFEAVDPDGSCNLPVQIALVGGGNATHVGLFTADLTWCFLPPQGPLFISGTVIAANGDEIYIQTVGQGVGDNGEIYETFVFMGGTGRFTDVSGNFDLYTTTEFDPTCGLCGTYTNYGEGTISY